MTTNLDFTQTESATPFQTYLNTLQKSFASPLFLAFTIVMTCLSGFLTISLLQTLSIISLFSIIELAMAILTTVACWMTRNAAKKNDDFIKHVPLMRAYPTFNLVLYYIGAIICGLCGFLMTIIAILLKDTWQDAWTRALEQLRAKPDQLSPQGWEVIEKLDKISPHIPTVFAIVFLIIAAVMILAIIRETKLVRIIKSLSASAVTGKIPHLKIGFFSGLTYTIVGFLLVQTATSVTGPVIGTLTSLCTIGALALPVIMLNLVKEDIHKCEALQKSEDTI